LSIAPQSIALALCAAALAAAVAAFLALRLLSLSRRIREADDAIAAFMGGDRSVRLEGSKEGSLSRLFSSVNAMAASLETHAERERAGRETLKDTISDISHQMKTPLAALRMYSEILSGEVPEEGAAARFNRKALGEVGRMESLVASLLVLARLDADAIALRVEERSLKPLLEEAVERFAARAELEGKRISLDCPEGAVLACDRDWLLEAIGNLVKNALDHTRTGQAVSLSCEESPLMTRIAIRDTGSGIHPEDLYHIFKRFYRSRFTQDAKGVGIGLTIAKAIVERQGGSISVESEPGRGSAFFLSFPKLTSE